MIHLFSVVAIKIKIFAKIQKNFDLDATLLKTFID